MIDQCDPQEICRRATEALASSPIHALRTLVVHRDHDSLKVTGRVACFYHKQVAYETIRSISRGMKVINRVDVS